jgi:large subunit ribosomal protein L29
MKTAELRDTSDEGLRILLKEAKEAVFKLRIQSRMERLDSPSELKKSKKMIARVYTLMNERERERGKQNQ